MSFSDLLHVRPAVEPKSRELPYKLNIVAGEHEAAYNKYLKQLRDLNFLGGDEEIENSSAPAIVVASSDNIQQASIEHFLREIDAASSVGAESAQQFDVNDYII